MNAKNLAIVLAPNILRPRATASIDHAKMVIHRLFGCPLFAMHVSVHLLLSTHCCYGPPVCLPATADCPATGARNARGRQHRGGDDSAARGRNSAKRRCDYCIPHTYSRNPPLEIAVPVESLDAEKTTDNNTNNTSGTADEEDDSEQPPPPPVEGRWFGSTLPTSRVHSTDPNAFHYHRRSSSSVARASSRRPAARAGR